MQKIYLKAAVVQSIFFAIIIIIKFPVKKKNIPQFLWNMSLNS